ncbi:molybdopterin-synthase adenylyltransferase MoeB [Marinobacterium stanieri]|uniref:molybdopterin-synthase adenylyltransferase MoeB n=1 Tax=Marinobacterium stanieri TaxID=49186 RepID=UPI00025587FF|nr:molybdopterin-synthase adenylyltransferase MoeB [Marinobacterium stanieri]
MMNDQELMRYSRSIMLPEVDIAGQEAWRQARVLILGLGGLGGPVAAYLAAAGVGELVLVDDDEVEASNLQRQIIHSEEACGQAKVESAAASLSAINSGVKVVTRAERLQGEALQQQVADMDLVLDCSDNFATRFALNKACFATGTPLVSGAAIRFDGQISVYDPRDPESPCYQCLYRTGDDEALTCSESGVFPPLVGIIGSMQAMEALKLLARVGDSLTGRLLLLDGQRMQWRSLKLRPDPECPICRGEHRHAG